MTISRLLSLLASFAVAALFILAWKLVADHKLVSPVFLPGPDRTWTALVRGFSTGDLDVKRSQRSIACSGVGSSPP